MDITAPKTTSMIDSLAASKGVGGEGGGDSESAAVSFSNILKNNNQNATQAGTQNALGAMLSNNSQTADQNAAAQSDDYDDVPDEPNQSYETNDYADKDVQAPSHNYDDEDAQAAVTQDDDVHHDAGKQDAAPDDRPDTNEGHDEGPNEGETTTENAQEGEANDQQASDTEGQSGDDVAQTPSETETGGENVAGVGDLQEVVETILTSSEAAVQASSVAATTTTQNNTPMGDVSVTAPAAEGKASPVVQQAAGAQNQGAAKAQTNTADGAQLQNQANVPQADAKAQSTDSTAQTQQTTQKSTQNTHILGQNQTAQAAEASAAKMQDGKAQPVQTATAAQQQAQDLSKKVGPNTRMDVSVSVENEGAKLTSRPTASLTPAAQSSATPSTHQTAQSPQAAQQAQQLAAQANIQAAAQQQLAQAGQGATAAQSASTQATGAQGATVVSGGESASPASTAAPGVATQQTVQTQTAAKEEAAKPQPQNHRATVDQVSVQITKAMKANADSIRIQMKPASLGRVDIHLEMSDGKVSATVVADNKDTLDMLQRGSRDLARALSSAGLSADSDSLNYSLREQGGQQNQAGGGAKGEGQPGFANAASENESDPLVQAVPTNIISENRVDIRA